MRVVVRVRPAISDQESEQRSIVRVLDDVALMFDPKEEVEHFYFRGVKQLGRNLLRKTNKELRFNFDTVFCDEATNENVHTATTKPILDGLLDGYNCSVFAYGATGSGKTFTMLGNAENPGITFLTVMELYERIETLRSDMIIDLAVSYLEVYNENVKDLLTPSSILQVREDQHRGVIVPGLTLHKPKGAEELLEMLRLGNHRRTQHPTDANAESSRSHAVFTVYVKQQDRSNGNKSGLSAIRVSKMALIDLAGSERASMVSRGNGSRLREGANINKSLLALGNCINALADKKGHVPFRNSKLTRLLKDSLDGHCRTVMIAAISPAASNYEDTYNTLKYAARAKNIKTNSKQNMIDIVVPTGQHMKVIQDLQKEVADLKRRLHESQPPVSNIGVTLAVPLQQPLTTNAVDGEVDAIQIVIKDMFGERETLTRQFLEVSCRVREIELRVQRRQKCLERLALLAITSNRMDESACKTDNAVARMMERRERQFAQRTALGQRLANNSGALAKAEETAAGTNSQVLCEWLKTQHCKVDLKVSQFREHHACRAAIIQQQETNRCDRLLSESLRVMQRQYFVLMATGQATSDIIEDFDAIRKQVEEVKEVAWADQMHEDDDSATQLDIGSILNLSVTPLQVLASEKQQQERPVSLKGSTSSDETVASTSESKANKVRLYSPTCGKLLSTTACLSAKPPIHVMSSSAVCASTPSPRGTVIPTDDAGLNSTFSMETLEDCVFEATKENKIPRRCLAFDAPPQPLVPSSQAAAAAAAAVSSSESVKHGTLAPNRAANSKRPWRDGGGKIGGAAAKKLKPCSSLSNLSTAKSLRKFGFQSMFDKPMKLAEGATSKSKLNTLTKFAKMTPVQRNVLEPINANGNGTFINDAQSLSAKRPPKGGLKPTIEPRTNALSRQRSKSTTNLKTPQ